MLPCKLLHGDARVLTFSARCGNPKLEPRQPEMAMCDEELSIPENRQEPPVDMFGGGVELSATFALAHMHLTTHHHPRLTHHQSRPTFPSTQHLNITTMGTHTSPYQSSQALYKLTLTPSNKETLFSSTLTPVPHPLNPEVLLPRRVVVLLQDVNLTPSAASLC